MLTYGQFKSHSGLLLPWKIDLDCWTYEDWAAAALIVRHKFLFSRVVGVPQGGLKFAEALDPYCVKGYPEMIVDDVWTIGSSMQEWKERKSLKPEGIIGVVVFARGPIDNWIWPMFQVNEWTQSRGTGIG